MLYVHFQAKHTYPRNTSVRELFARFWVFSTVATWPPASAGRPTPRLQVPRTQAQVAGSASAPRRPATHLHERRHPRLSTNQAKAHHLNSAQQLIVRVQLGRPDRSACRRHDCGRTVFALPRWSIGLTTCLDPENPQPTRYRGQAAGTQLGHRRLSARSVHHGRERLQDH